MVHQHFTLAENLTGFQNIVLGTEPLWKLGYGGGGAREKVDRIAAEAGLEVDLDAPVSRLSVGEKQRVEILKALYRDVRVLILDEPTAVLTPIEAEGLSPRCGRSRRAGLPSSSSATSWPRCIALCQRIVVLRGGRKVADRPAQGVDRATLADLMVGRSIEVKKPERRYEGDPVLRSGACERDGRAGSRRTAQRVAQGPWRRDRRASPAYPATARARWRPSSRGSRARPADAWRWQAKRFTAPTPPTWWRAAWGASRRTATTRAASARMSIAENLILENPRDASVQRFGFLRKAAIRAHAEKLIDAFDVRCPGPDAPIRLLSGGNMQKVILARALERSPMLILAHQPTRGLDVAATADVHRRLLAARDRGAGVLLISEDLDEIFAAGRPHRRNPPRRAHARAAHRHARHPHRGADDGRARPLHA